MASHSGVLAWRIPGTGEPGGLTPMGSHRVGHNWSDLAAAAALTLLWERNHRLKRFYIKFLGFAFSWKKKKSLKTFRLHSCKATINSWDKGFCICAVEPEMKLPTSAGSLKKQECFRETSISALLTMPKPLTVWITINCGKFWKRWEYQTTWPASWKTYMQVRKQPLELDMEQQTGSK